MLIRASELVCDIPPVMALDANPDPDPEPTLFDRSRTIKNRIELTTDADGRPELPCVTASDAYQTKSVQAALRDYCTASIRESNNILR